jgi:hypothetical protein
MQGATNVAPYYAGWQLANDSLIGAIEHLTRAQLALPLGWPTWPIWASVSHIAGARVFWLHTRQSVLWRLITHDALHSVEISLALGRNGLGAVEMRSGLSRLAD